MDRSTIDMNPERSIVMDGAIFHPAKLSRSARSQFIDSLSDSQVERLLESRALGYVEDGGASTPPISRRRGRRTRTEERFAAAQARLGGGGDGVQEKAAEDTGDQAEDNEAAGPSFASDAARDAASNLSPGDFDGRVGSGADGSFTKSDVIDLLQARDG